MSPSMDEMIENLLGPRESMDLPAHAWRDRVVLVTGAGGTIGSQLCRSLLDAGASRIVALEKDEYALYQLHQALPDRVVPALGDYGDQGTVSRLLSAYGPDCVIHAGAYKHVPLVERNPISGVINNVLKFRVLLDCVAASNVKSLIVVSTDKAVRPTNVMGATKRLVEILALNCKQVPRVSVVRFGNVLGSSGSVLPLWMSQWKQALALTVTDKEVSRYFMSVREAVSLILRSHFLDGVNVLDMGEPVKLMDMAKRFRQLIGFPDYPIQVIGLRPGEKMHEELYRDSFLEKTLLDRVLTDRSRNLPPAHFDIRMTQMELACELGDPVSVVQQLRLLIPEYTPACSVQDDVFAHLDDCFRTPSPEVYP